MRVWVVVGALCAASGAFAQAASPSVAPFPLQVIRPTNLGEKQLADLQATLKVLMRRSAVSVADSAKLGAALKDLKREDCDRDNECLAQLARLSGSLYALFAAIDLTAEGDLVAWGRVVREDGKVVSDCGREKQVRVAKARDRIGEASEQALAQLMVVLALRDLPATKPVEGTGPVVVAPPPALVAPPVLIEPASTSNRKVAGFVAAGVGAAAAVVGLGLIGGGAAAGAGAIDPNTGYVLQGRIDDYRSARALQTAGAVMAGLGAAVAAVGLVVGATAPGRPALAVTPVAGGAALSVGGAFP